jgi:hypothetical protein
MVTDAEKEFCFDKMGMSGSFMEKLISTIQRADTINQGKLAMGFPELVGVVRRYQSEPGYWEDLVERFNEQFPNSNLRR